MSQVDEEEYYATANCRRDLRSGNRPKIANDRKTRRSSIKEVSSSGNMGYPGLSKGKMVNVLCISQV
jgi:hypothetical protein